MVNGGATMTDLPQLVSAVLHLEPREAAVLPAGSARVMHRAFMMAIERVVPGLPERLHGPGARLQPFTVSLLSGVAPTPDGYVSVRPGERLSWRLTALTPELAAVVDQVRRLRTIEVDHRWFDVVGVDASPGDWGGVSSYAEVYARAGADRRLALEFASPTAFKAGDGHVPFPLPDSVFLTYLEAWTTFGNVDLDLPLESLVGVCRQAIHAESFRLRSADLVLDPPSPGRGRPYPLRQTGYVGTCVYRVDERDPRVLRAMNALADLALYCGTGAKKTQGAGQTRRVPLPGA